MKMQRVVYLAGVGGVGKTTMVDAIEKSMPDVMIVRSASRKAYVDKGVTERQALAETEDQRIEFQTQIFKDYKQSWDDAIYSDAQVILFERSPFDYLSYQAATLPTLSLAAYEAGQYVAQHMMAFADLHQTILYVPFPVPWERAETASESEDEVRYAPSGKNLAWDSVLRRMIWGKGQVHPVTGSSVGERVSQLKACLAPNYSNFNWESQWTHFSTRL